MRPLMKGEDNNTDWEEEREKKMHVNAYHNYCKQLKLYTWHNKFAIEHKFDNLPYFF